MHFFVLIDLKIMTRRQNSLAEHKEVTLYVFCFCDVTVLLAKHAAGMQKVQVLYIARRDSIMLCMSLWLNKS